MKKGLISCVSVCLLLLIWQLIASSMDQPELIPSVPELIKALFQLFGTDTFYKSISTTILRGISGIILSLEAAGDMEVGAQPGVPLQPILVVGFQPGHPPVPVDQEGHPAVDRIVVLQAARKLAVSTQAIG